MFSALGAGPLIIGTVSIFGMIYLLCIVLLSGQCYNCPRREVVVVVVCALSISAMINPTITREDVVAVISVLALVLSFYFVAKDV